ncbi:MAG TPA: MoaD/ThiS family protein [Leeuwenhoekiella sp.]|nr:MoaD/ThiS family protein [Leeuwenhoekiella sp.]
MLTIHYFGEIADKTGRTSEKLQPQGKQVSALLEALQEKYALQHDEFQVAVNHQLIDLSADMEVEETDEIALLSAFAGG